MKKLLIALLLIPMFLAVIRIQTTKEGKKMWH
jgi:ABC-type transport system involved in cytochrome bd biosynthesis fused ATPase/permease subunit